MKRWLNPMVVMAAGLVSAAGLWTGCDSGTGEEDPPRSRLDPEPFQVRENCIRFVKWHHLKSGKVSHIAYALTRSRDERAVFRSFGMDDGELTFQIDGFLEPDRMESAKGDGGRLRGVDYRKERLTGKAATPENVQSLIRKASFQMVRPEALSRKHTIYVFCGFTDEEMDRMELRERNIRREIERFRAKRGKSFNSFNCSVSGAIVGCEGGKTGLRKPWNFDADRAGEFRQRYSSLQTALMDLALIEAVAIGRGEVEGEFERTAP